MNNWVWLFASRCIGFSDKIGILHTVSCFIARFPGRGKTSNWQHPLNTQPDKQLISLRLNDQFGCKIYNMDPPMGARLDESAVPPLLSDRFALHPQTKENYLVSVNYVAIRCDLITTNGQVSSRARELLFADIVGCDCMRGKSNSDICAYVTVYTYPHRKKIASKKTLRQRQTITLTFKQHATYEENSRSAEKWYRVIVSLARGTKIRNPEDVLRLQLGAARKMLVLVNPFSGPGKALSIFQERVVPMLAEAGYHFNLVVTERAGHGRDIVRTMKLSDWYGIVIVSGDGLVYEVVNGLMDRMDWEEAIKMPIGAIPGGSGNALCCSLNYAAGEPFQENFPLHSAFIIAKHTVVPLDLVAIDTCKQRLYSFLSISWAIFADVDIESEKYRSLGATRFAVGAISRIVNLRKYPGRLSFLPAGDYQPRRGRTSTMTRSVSEVTGNNWEQGRTQRSQSATMFPHPTLQEEEEDYAVQGEQTHAIGEDESQPVFLNSNGEEGMPIDGQPGPLNATTQSLIKTTSDNSVSDSSDVGASVPVSSTSRCHVPTPLLAPLGEPVPHDWFTIEDEFVMFTAAYQTHLAPDIKFSPESHLQDGTIYLMFCRAGISRQTMVRLFLTMDQGKHYNHQDVEVIKVKAFRLEPLTKDGILAVDGEVVDYGPIQAQVLPSLGRVMCLKK